MSRYIVLDIETADQPPEAFMVPDVDLLDPPATHKKPESIAAWREERRAALPGELRAKSSLEPLIGGIVVCVGLAIDDQPVHVLTVATVDEAGEHAILARLEAGLLRHPEATLITWNGSGFDLEYLRKRALRHGLVSLARRMYHEKPWNSARHVDLRAAWCGANKTAPGRLGQVARYLGIEVKDDHSGAQVSALIEAGQLAAVTDHCRSDVTITREILYRFADAGWVLVDCDSPEWSVREWRPSERDGLISQIAACELDATDDQLRAAGAAAGLEWLDTDAGGAPGVSEHTPMRTLRAYLDGLRQHVQAPRLKVNA